MLRDGRSFQNSPPKDIDDALILTTTIRVMVVDHKRDLLSCVGELLRAYAFEVTCVDHAGAALKVLSERKDQFDALLIDSELRDVDILTFLRITKAMGVLSMVMCEEEDDGFLLQALKNGASLVFKRPLTSEGIKKARQQVLKDRIHKYEHKFRILPPDLARNIIDENDADFAKKKVCLEWTEELHSKFLEAICVLGEGRCFPKDILETMGVPGLTRMQIASHLQKCRRDGWKFIGKQEPSSTKNMIFSSDRSHEVVDSRRFGRMPCVAPNSANQEERIPHYDAPPLSNIGRQMDVNYMNNQSFPDYSLVNGNFGSFRNNEVFPGPSVGQGSNHPIFPPNQASEDFYVIMNDFDTSGLSIPFVDLNMPGLNNNTVAEPDFNQVMPNQGAQVFNKSM